MNDPTKKSLSQYFVIHKSIETPRILRVVSISMLALLLMFLISMVIVPWQQTTSGEGEVIALDPNSRIQEIHTMVSGIASKWYVRDGDQVKFGDPIVDIVDNDPLFVERLSRETEAKRRKVDVSKIAAETAKKDADRQAELFNQGLSSRKVFEKAMIEYKKLLSQLANDEAELAKAETSLSRQHRRTVVAPSDGTVLSVLSGVGNVLVKEGEAVAQFLPMAQDLAVEVFVKGNDFPLVERGRLARIQFEGWPAIQATGWPNLAIGTFEGKVWAVDSSRIQNGRYRVVIVPQNSKPWPDSEYLRQGTRVNAWIVLDRVRLGFELWRRFNGFPLAINNQKYKIKKSTTK
ncbi:MAG: HlyD family efflux transporter periplasmic adaptor subunit [Bdellovibrionales bacterium]|nr:HlyD family efflux transporter periplasmic adaptor subunit [Bdellovibrionales bacterium]